VKSRPLNKRLYSASAWAIFTLGATQLALVLSGPVVFLIVMLGCAALYAFFLFKVADPGTRSLRKNAKHYLHSASILLFANALYVYLVFLEPDLSDVIFLSAHVLIFMIPLLVVTPFFRKSSYVTQ
jgi:hypothetical protein